MVPVREACVDFIFLVAIAISGNTHYVDCDAGDKKPPPNKAPSQRVPVRALVSLYTAPRSLVQATHAVHVDYSRDNKTRVSRINQGEGGGGRKLGGGHPVIWSPCEHSGVCTDCPRRRNHSAYALLRRDENWKRQKPEVRRSPATRAGHPGFYLRRILSQPGKGGEKKHGSVGGGGLVHNHAVTQPQQRRQRANEDTHFAKGCSSHNGVSTSRHAGCSATTPTGQCICSAD